MDSLPNPLTLVYKSFSDISIHADVYLPASASSPKHPLPILLFIHGGGWMFGSRKEIPRIFFCQFLSRNFVVVSIDYRLLPESDFLTGQLEDIRDVEVWLREELPGILTAEVGVETDAQKIVVLGGSAGAHLALLTVSAT